MVIMELLIDFLTETTENRNSPVYLVLLTKGGRVADILMQNALDHALHRVCVLGMFGV